MCGRYVFWKKKPAGTSIPSLEKLNRGGLLALSGGEDVFPGSMTAVYANNRALVPSAFAMRWGYTLPGHGRIINARSETAREKPLFRDGILHRRCLIPAQSYYEWDASRAKYLIMPRAEENCFLAGLYRIEENRPVFVVLTREPAESIAFIHNRMPVIFPPVMMEAWLCPENPPEELLREAITEVEYEVCAR